MGGILLIGIFVAASLIFQIFFLRVAHDKLNLEKNDPRFVGMIQLIYVNLGIYLLLIGLLALTLLKR